MPRRHRRSSARRPLHRHGYVCLRAIHVLPPICPPFAKRFLACVYTVAWKLHSPDTQVLACVGEELALHALIQRAEAILDDKGTEADFDLLRDSAFEDEDYALLFDPQLDGIEDSERGRRLGVANLRYDDWFLPFRDEALVHPYAAT